MRKIMFVGRSESGKTTIMQAMKGKPITYHKTQYVNNFDELSIHQASTQRRNSYQGRWQFMDVRRISSDF